MKPRRYIYYALMAGAFTPLVIDMFAVSKLRMPYNFINPGTIVLMLLSLIPFGALIGIVFSTNLKGARLACIFWFGFLAVWGYTTWEYWQMWQPFFTGQHINSTHSIGLLFIPVYALVPMAIGLIVGWGVSFLPPFQ